MLRAAFPRGALGSCSTLAPGVWGVRAPERDGGRGKTLSFRVFWGSFSRGWCPQPKKVTPSSLGPKWREAGSSQAPEGEGGSNTRRRTRRARPRLARAPRGRGRGLSGRNTPRSRRLGRCAGRPRGRGRAGRGGSGPLPRLGLVGRWRRRFPGSPAPDADGGAFRPSPTSVSPTVAGAGEAGRAGSRGGKARGRRLRGAGGGGGGRRAGGRAGEEEEAGAVSHAAPGGAAPAAEGRSQTLAGRGFNRRPGSATRWRRRQSPLGTREMRVSGGGAGAEGRRRRRRRPGSEPRCRSDWGRGGRAQAPGEA